MTDEPEKIWTLAGNRQHWQNVPPQDGQKTWHWVEYTHSDIADALQAEVARLTAALETITLEYDTSGHGTIAEIMFGIARAAQTHREADQ